MGMLSTAAYTQMPDARQLDRCLAGIASGDQESLAELYQAAGTAVYSFSLSILKNRQDAEDALHDTFVSIYAASGIYRSMGKPMAWILTVARNQCRKLLRERSRSPEALEELWEQDLESPEPISAEEKLLLRECLFRLTEEERQIVTLHAVSGFRHWEIAAFLSLPLSTVLSKYSRAVKKLRRSLREEEHG